MKTRSRIELKIAIRMLQDGDIAERISRILRLPVCEIQELEQYLDQIKENPKFDDEDRVLASLLHDQPP